MKRVLMIAYLFPPIVNSGTQRPLKFAKYLSQYGWEPIVLTASHFDGQVTDQALLDEVPSSIRVVRVPGINDLIGDAVATVFGGGTIGHRLGDALRWHIRDHYRTPDLYAPWKWTATRAALRLYRDEGFDAVFATGFPWSSLQIGSAVAAATGRPLVTDFRDLWAGETLFRDERTSDEHYRARELSAERAVVESSDAVIAASTSIARHLSAAHPNAGDGRFVAIHNGFDPEDIDVPSALRAPTRFRIVYTGVWKDGYNPEALYDSIDWIRRTNEHLLDDVEVITAGFTPGEAQRRGLSRYITELGVITHQHAVGLMKSASLLYLSHVDPDRQWVVPGKLYEYLASGAPVLALTIPDRETAQIISAVGGGVAVSPEDPGTFFHLLEETLRTRALPVPPRNDAALSAFERKHLTSRLAEVLDDVVSRVPVIAPERRLAYTTFSTRAGSSPGTATRSS